MSKITSPRRIARAMAALQRQLQSGLNDPMTDHYGAGEFVLQAARDKVRRFARQTPYTADECDGIACAYWQAQHAKRTAHRDPARLRWLASMVRAGARDATKAAPIFEDVPY